MEDQILIVTEFILWIISIIVIGFCWLYIYQIHRKQKTSFALSTSLFFFFFIWARICVLINIYVFNYTGEITYLLNYPEWLWMQIGYNAFSNLGVFFAIFIVERDIFNTKYFFSCLIVIHSILAIVNNLVVLDLVPVSAPLFALVLLTFPILYFYVARKSTEKLRISSFFASIGILIFGVGIALAVPEGRVTLWSPIMPSWVYLLFAPILQIIGSLIFLKGIMAIQSPAEKLVMDQDTMRFQRNKLLQLATAAIKSSKIKKAIKLYEQAGKISKKLGEHESYILYHNKAKELKSSLIQTLTTFKPMDDFLTSTSKEKGVTITRGGEVVGGKVIYKVKVKNNTDYNITDISVFLISYPRECMGLSSNKSRTVPKIEPEGFRSLEFEFEPHKDCVEGTIHASVIYIDHLNESNTEKVQPYVIRHVCDLLRPYTLEEEKFDHLILNWEKTGEFTKIHENIYELFQRCKDSLKRHNFSVISAKLQESDEVDDVRGFVKACAEGKYVGKKVGMIIEITGKKEGDLSEIRTRATSEDEGMMASPIIEVLEDFKQSGLKLDEMTESEQERFVKEKLIQNLRFMLVIHKENGITLFSKGFGKIKLDPDLISGFITAITVFGGELSGDQKVGIRKMEYETLKIILRDGRFVNVGLILADFPEKWLNLKLELFIKEFEKHYADALVNWIGDTTPFETTLEIFKKVFEIS